MLPELAFSRIWLVVHSSQGTELHKLDELNPKYQGLGSIDSRLIETT